MHERQANTGAPLSVFISYAHEDERLRQQLEVHLSLLRRQGWIADWHDRQILAGDEWAHAIDQHLEAASMILLLISPDFLASDYCYDIEMQQVLERHKRGEVRVIPIILRPCDWHTSPFASLQSLPRDGKAVTIWQNQDEAFLAIVQGLRRIIERQQIPRRPLPEVERQNRIRLMKRVRTIWIEGLLERSLHQAMRLDLHFQDLPDVLQGSLHLQVQELMQGPRPLPAGTSITQLYDDADEKLLILGEPGAGKTMQLLELTRTLLTRAEHDPDQPLPVIFPLVSWAQKCLPLADWIVKELVSKNYEVPPRIAQGWIEAGRIVPLLDGLDEVAGDVRANCVQAIADYYQHRLEQGRTSLVVCCRSQEYEAFTGHLPLQRAVSILPLTDEQVGQYLLQAGNRLEVLRTAISGDAELAELVRRPLMLNIFTLAYQGATAADLPVESTHEATLHTIFATYIEQMLTRRRELRSGTKDQFRRWLIFLAQQMLCHNQTVFFVENLQPDWLSGIPSILYGLSFRLFVGLAFGLPLGLIFGLAFGLGPSMAMVVGLVVGLGFMLITLWGKPPSRIQPAEALTWSWRKVQFHLHTRLVVVLSIAVVMGLFLTLVAGLLTNSLVSTLFGMLTAGIAIGLGMRLSGSQLPDHLHFSPNEGIWHSGKNGLALGLGSMLIVGLVIGLGGTPVSWLALALAVGLLVGLHFGLGAFIEHFLLRILLGRLGELPWNLIAFLDEAEERLLLHKVGGGYIFVHRLLLDYFASLEKKES